MASNFARLLILSALYTIISTDQLLLLNFVHRHGERMPAIFYPGDPHKHDYWPRGEGQLTNEGKRQEYMLGKFVKQQYKNFIGDRYFANITRYRSTDVDRTLMSAQLVSAGIFKPQGDDVWDDQLPWQPVPIHTVDVADDYVLSTGSRCPKFNRLYTEALEKPPLSTIIEDYKDMFEYLSKYTGMIVNFQNIWEIYDDVSKELARNMTEPDWIMKVWNRVVKLNDRQFGLLAPTREMQRLKGGPFIKEVVEACKAKAAGNMTYNMLMYSAHDTTIGTLLDTLNIYNGLQPPYASAVFIEFYHVGKSQLQYSDYAIKFLYRNTSTHVPYPMLIPGCDDVLCRFDRFLQIVDDILPEDIVKECNSDETLAQKLDIKFLAIAIAGFLLLEIIAGVIICYIFKRRQKPKYHRFNDGIE